MDMKRSALAAALAGVVGYAIIVAEADHAARHTVERVLASHPGWRVADVVVEPWSGRVKLRGLDTSSGATTVSIGTLDLPLRRDRFGLIGSAFAASPNKTPAAPPTPPPRPDLSPVAPVKPSDTAAADNVVITSGTTTYRIRHVGLTGTKLTDADLATLLDARSETNPGARLKSLTAAAVEIPEIVGDDTTPGSRRHWSATKILLANVISGKAAAGSANGIAFAVTQGGETVEGTLGAMRGTGLDLPQIAHLLASRSDKEPVLPVGETFGVEAIKLANVGKGTSVALAALKATAVSARPLRSDHAASGEPDSAAKDQQTKDQPIEDRPTLLEDLTLSFAVGTLDADDLAAAHKDAASNSSFAAKRLFLKDVRDGQGTGGVREAHLDQEDLHAAFGSIDFDDLSTASPTGKGSSVKGMVAAGQIAVSTRPRPGDADAAPLAFKVVHLAVAGDLPNDLAVAVDHLTFQAGNATATARTLSEVGYPSLDLSGALAARYDANAKTLAIDKLSVTGADMGTATLSLQLANAGGGLVSPNADVAEAAALALLVKSCDLRLDNAGFFEKALAWRAKNDAVSVADERALGVEFFTHTLPASIGGSNAKVLGAAIGRFIATPKTLQVTASSKDGLGAADFGLLASPDVLLDRLDLHASANGQPAVAPDGSTP